MRPQSSSALNMLYPSRKRMIQRGMRDLRATAPTTSSMSWGQGWVLHFKQWGYTECLRGRTWPSVTRAELLHSQRGDVAPAVGEQNIKPEEYSGALRSNGIHLSQVFNLIGIYHPIFSLSFPFWNENVHHMPVCSVIVSWKHTTCLVFTGSQLKGNSPQVKSYWDSHPNGYR